MLGTEGIVLWWLIPIVLIVLCLFCMRGCCFGRRRDTREGGERHPPGNEGRDGMRAEETTRTDRGEENAFFMDCCYPGKRSEMMAHCGDDMKGKCGAAMEEMMRGDFNPTKEK